MNFTSLNSSKSVLFATKIKVIDEFPFYFASSSQVETCKKVDLLDIS